MKPPKLALILLGLILVLAITPSLSSDVFAQSNPNLYVSAENAQFLNYMSGSQVIEVIVIDSEIDDVNIPQGEPDVTVNGNALRMLQSVDGNWYGYFADRDMAQIADSTAVLENGVGLDYGDFCSATDATNILGIDLTETDGVAVSNTGEIDGLIGSSIGGFIIDNCVFTPGTPDNTMNVLRETKTLNIQSETGIGQMGLTNIDHWPFIQVYELNPTGDVQVQYNKGGGPQAVVLVFDTAENLAETQLDRSFHPQNSHVHVTITDLWLNIDPTDEDSWTFGALSSDSSTNYQVFDENGLAVGDIPANTDDNLLSAFLSPLMCEDNCIFLIDPNAQGAPINPLTISDNDDSEITGTDANDILSFQTIGGNLDGNIPVTITELGPNTGIFGTYDESDESILKTTSNAMRGTSGTIDYNESPVSIVIDYDWGDINMDGTAIGFEWTSGEEIPVILVDGDLNKNSKVDEDLDFYNPDVELIPSLQIGTPFTLENLSDAQLSNSALTIQDVQWFSQRALLESTSITIQNGDSLQLSTTDTFTDLFNSINNPAGTFSGFNYFNYDIRSIEQSIAGGAINSIDVDVTDGQSITRIGSTSQAQGLLNLVDATGADIFSMNPNSNVQIIFTFDVTGAPIISDQTVLPVAADFFSFGIINDGALASERISNMLLRAELEETGDNTSTFEGTLQFTMINQLNVKDSQTYDGLSTIDEDSSFIVPLGLTDEFSPRITYADLGKDGVVTPISDQQEAPSHSGVVSFDADSYKIGDRVDVTLDDDDLNLSSVLIDVYTPVSPSSHPTDPARDTIGKDGLGLYSTIPLDAFGRLLDVSFDDERWSSGETLNGGACGAPGTPDDGLFATGLTLIETNVNTGIFLGDFMVPITYCNSVSGLIETTPGTDIEVNYVDYTDAGNSIIEVGDAAGIRANTGSVSLDRVVYPVPFGSVSDFFPGLSESDNVTPDGDSIFPVHQTGVIADGDQNIDVITEEIIPGDLLIHVRVSDPDFDINPVGIDEIALGEHGPVEIMLTRGSETLLLATAGGVTANTGVITHGSDIIPSVTREVGPITELAPDAGVFEFSLPIRYTDGPDSAGCPVTPDEGYTSLNGTSGPLGRFNEFPQNGSYCILSGDVITAEYNDPVDASGSPNTVTDTANTDLRDGLIQTDKTEYIIGADMIFTLIEPDFDLDNDKAETYDLDLIEWDSDAATLTVGDLGGEIAAFDPEPLYIRETGDSTGIFQVVLEIPNILQGNPIEEGTEITLEYTDWGITGAPYVGIQSQNFETVITTEEFMVTANTDSSLYVIGETVTISGTVDPVFSSQSVTTIIKNPSGNAIAISQTTPQADGTYSDQFVITSPLWDEIGTYDADVTYYTASTSVSFEVETNALFCNDMNISQLLSSGLYNVINNKDGHLDGLRITGTNGDDLILASDAGNDIRAKKGNDCVIGGSGDDQLRGGNGEDTMFGRDGNDLLIGGKLNDVLYGGNGNDQIRGSANNDQLFGENGDDNLKGNAGDDALSCGVGTDVANGGRGTDTATADCETIKGVP